MATAAVDVRHFTREEYERLVEQGFFHPEERIELVDGVILEMTPQSSGHAAGVVFAQAALQPLYRDGFHIRSQLPLALGLDSEPEPDLAVIPGPPGDYVAAHPQTAVLVLEVADSSLLHDRNSKASLYARAGIPEYWLLNLVDWSLEVGRTPLDGRYTSWTVLREGDSVSPLTHAAVAIPVASLLPRPTMR
ncbi:MAG TPA: Uma2 family endonuclease [Thermoanaerobaculia bacterium]